MWRCADMDKACQKVLLQHHGVAAAAHIQGDLTERLSQEDRDALRAVVQEAQQKLAEAQRRRSAQRWLGTGPRGLSNKELRQNQRSMRDLKQMIGQETFRAGVALVRSSTMKSEAFCVKCQRDCPVSPTTRASPRHGWLHRDWGQRVCPVVFHGQARGLATQHHSCVHHMDGRLVPPRCDACHP